MIEVGEYFDLRYGTSLELYKLVQSESGVNFVGRASQNNGVVARVEPSLEIEANPAGTISVALGGSVMESFLQESPYYSGRDVVYLIPRVKLNRKQFLFYCMCLRANKFRYSYGRQANKTLAQIQIPEIDEMPTYVQRIRMPSKPSRAPKLQKKIVLPKSRDWKDFSISELFSIKGTKTTKLEDLVKYGSGKYPYVTTQAVNNGVAGFYDYFTEEGGVITVDSAVLGFASYQRDNFSASDHVEKLIPKFSMNSYLAMFFVVILNADQFRYNYGRKASQDRMRQRKIKLPAKPGGDPDFELMARFIKSLPFSSNLPG